MALQTTVDALGYAQTPVERAAAFHQSAVLIDDHPLPTHDEVAWRAALAAYREHEDEEVYAREAVRRHIYRSPFLQIFRSWGNFFLYAAIVVLAAGKRFPPAYLLVGPLSVPLLVPGLLAHGSALAIVACASRVFRKRIMATLRGRPEDLSIQADLVSTVERAWVDIEKAQGDQVSH